MFQPRAAKFCHSSQFFKIYQSAAKGDQKGGKSALSVPFSAAAPPCGNFPTASTDSGKIPPVLCV
jgi:hypothetical protein